MNTLPKDVNGDYFLQTEILLEKISLNHSHKPPNSNNNNVCSNLKHL